MGLLGLLVAFGLLPGVLLMVWGWSGKRVGDHPHCARCRFDLFGVYPGADVCPECGQKLWLPGAVIDGQPVRRRRPLVAGAVLVAVSFSLLGVFTAWAVSSSAAYARLPGFLLVRVIDTPEARGEVLTRLQAGRLSAGGARVAVERALDIQADPSVQWDPAWGELIEEAWAGGLIVPAQLERYARQATRPRLHHRPRVQKGRRLNMVFHDPSAKRFGPGVRLRMEYPLVAVRRNGEARSDVASIRTPAWQLRRNGGHIVSNVIGLIDEASAGTFRYEVEVRPEYTIDLPARNVSPYRFTDQPVTHRTEVEVTEGFSGSYVRSGESDRERGEQAGVWIGPEPGLGNEQWVMFGASLPERPAWYYKVRVRYAGRVFDPSNGIRDTGRMADRRTIIGPTIGANDWSPDEPVRRIDVLVRVDVEREETRDTIEPTWVGEWIARDVPWAVPQPMQWQSRYRPPPTLVPVEARTLTPEAAMRPVTAADFD